MKKILVMCTCLLLSSSAFAFEIGFGLMGGVTQKTTNMDKLNNQITVYSSKTFNESYFIGHIEGFFEHNASETSAYGVKIGVGAVGEDELKFRQGLVNYKMTVDAVIFPVTVYYKHNLSKKFNTYLGAGATVMNARIENGPDDYNEIKVFPHINAGIEWRINRYVGLGLDGKYSFNSKISDIDGHNADTGLDVRMDLDGLSGGIMFRMYFGPGSDPAYY
ncbi:Outer membrane protein beta-barrel domain-containing protein [Parelusimicrobium proximum]|uniref:outer membrane beta-barrel protein n=1 Tax=Parelusimicrobium proximum TaxID=3228953 RepID=UPI003D180E3A